jgi:hypothetical protein
MLPTRQSQRCRTVGTFELITPAGCVYRFPRVTFLGRLLALMYAQAETAILSAVVLGLIYSAGLLGERLGPLSFMDCGS